MIAVKCKEENIYKFKFGKRYIRITSDGEIVLTVFRRWTTPFIMKHVHVIECESCTTSCLTDTMPVWMVEKFNGISDLRLVITAATHRVEVGATGTARPILTPTTVVPASATTNTCLNNSALHVDSSHSAAGSGECLVLLSNCRLIDAMPFDVHKVPCKHTIGKCLHFCHLRRLLVNLRRLLVNLRRLLVNLRRLLM